MTAKIDALQYLMMGTAEFETGASAEERKTIEAENRKKKPADRRLMADGFVQGSEAWEFSQLLKLPLVQMLHVEPSETVDMFAEPLTPRYWVEQALWESFPFSLAGEEPDDAYNTGDDGEYGGAFAWDENNVLFFCPRGICRLERQTWAEGLRRCQGC